GADLAVETRAARDVVVDDHAVALFEATGSARSETGHGTGDLVPEDTGGRNQPLLDLLDVRTADAADVDPHEHLARPDLRDRKLFHDQLIGPSIDGSLHEQGEILTRLSISAITTLNSQFSIRHR